LTINLLQIIEPKIKFQGKYRIESLRAQWWDYSSNGAYFITICTKARKHFFGEIADPENGRPELK
jgi:hypothetical protein